MKKIIEEGNTRRDDGSAAINPNDNNEFLLNGVTYEEKDLIEQADDLNMTIYRFLSLIFLLFNLSLTLLALSYSYILIDILVEHFSQSLRPPI